MNDRIKDLVEQAGIYITEPPFYFGDRASLKTLNTFAELIVEECIRQIARGMVRNGNTPENERSRQHVEDIRKYFGIE